MLNVLDEAFEVLKQGEYHGVEYRVCRTMSFGRWVYCGFINLPKGFIQKDWEERAERALLVHNGLSYAQKVEENSSEVFAPGHWVGWEYVRTFDRELNSQIPPMLGHQWNADDVFQDVMYAVDVQLHHLSYTG